MTTITRKDLLLVAEFVGLQPVCWSSRGNKLIVKHPGQGPESCLSFAWEPERDGEQALKLAVDLRLPLDIGDDYTAVQPLGVMEPHGGDPHAATRLAILRAGIEMAKRCAK